MVSNFSTLGLPLVLRGGSVQVTHPYKVLFSCYDPEALMSALRPHFGPLVTIHLPLCY
jgi:hypothetical protein